MFTQSEAARRIGTTAQLLGKLENLKEPAWGEHGWRPVAIRVADFYGLSPEYLWPEEIALVRKTAFSLELAAADVAALPPGEVELEAKEVSDRLLGALKNTPPRERLILAWRFGFGDADEHTLEEIGTKLGLSRERVRSLENRAIGGLRTDRALRTARGEPWRGG